MPGSPSSYSYELIVFTEDSYGKPFFKKLLLRLKEHNLLPKHLRIKVEHHAMPCNPKTIRLAVACFSPTPSHSKRKVLLIFDGDGEKNQRENDEINKIHQRAPSYRDRIHVLVFENEIEELIFWERKQRVPNKPSAYLKQHEKYAKKDLPKYADQLDINSISNHPIVSSIIALVNALTALPLRQEPCENTMELD